MLVARRNSGVDRNFFHFKSLRKIVFILDEDRWSLRFAYSHTEYSGLKRLMRSCTLDSRSPIWASEHHSRRSPSCAPTQSVLSRSSRSRDPTSLRMVSNNSSGESSSGSSGSNSRLQSKYTDHSPKSTRIGSLNPKSCPETSRFQKEVCILRMGGFVWIASSKIEREDLKESFVKWLMDAKN